MGAATFIANRLATYKVKSFTKTIIRMAFISIGLSVAIMILSSAIIEGFSRDIRAKVFGFWGHIHLTNAAATKSFEPLPIDLSLDYVEQVKEVSSVSYLEIDDEYEPISDKFVKTEGGVKHVQPFIVLPGLIETNDAFMAILFKGVDKDFDWDNMGKYLSDNSVVPSIDSLHHVVISKVIAEKMQLAVGDEFIISFIKNRNKIKRKLYIAGVYNTGLEEYDRRFVIGNISLPRDILEWDDQMASALEIFVDHPEDTKVIANYIYEDIIPLDMYAETIEDKFPNIFEWLKLQDINETVIYQLMTIVAIINMITVILILVLERTTMIGILKSLGANNTLLKKIFLVQAGHIVLKGLIVGNVLGLGIAFLQKKFGFIKLDETSYYLDTAPIHIDWMKVLLINCGAVTVILISLLLPIMIISAISPVKALRID